MNLPSKKAFEAYEKIRSEGKYNMFFPDAREATGLSIEEYAAVMDNYSELSEKYPEVRDDS